MQASKIIVGSLYALRVIDHNQHPPAPALVRYSVHAVVTRRTGKTNSPHDYTSTVEGWVTARDLPEGYTLEASKGAPDLSPGRIWHVTNPDQVEGPYEEVVELKAKAAAERAAVTARNAEQRRQTLAVRLALYRLAGLAAPTNDPDNYRQPIRAGDSAIGIDAAGVAALYRVLCEEKADV